MLATGLLALLAWAAPRLTRCAAGGPAEPGDPKPCPGRPPCHLQCAEVQAECRRAKADEDGDPGNPRDLLDAGADANGALRNGTLSTWTKWLWGADEPADGGSRAEELEYEADAEKTGGAITGRWAKRFFALRAIEEQRRTGGGDPNEERRRYMDAKLDIDLSAVRQFAVPAVKPPWPGRPPQVAFLFLAMKELDFEEIWDRFFSGAPAGNFSIYVHQAALLQTSSSLRATRPLPLGRWGAVDVHPVATGWCALVGVEVALLVAALQDARNQQFVFLSHNTVPLKSFKYVYRQLVLNSPTTSKFCFAEPAFYLFATTETIRNELLRTCVFRDFYRGHNPRTLKHHQWVVLARSHAETLVRDAELALHVWRRSWEAAAPDLTVSGEGCSDESVPITALLHNLQEQGRSTGNTWADLTRLGVEQQCLTYVLWRHCFGDTELELSEPITKELDIVRRHGKIRMLTDKDFDFFKSALKRELNGYPAVFEHLTMDYLWKLVRQGFMFARKFVRGIQVSVDGGLVALETALTSLWESVDEEEASRKVWSRLSTEGVPRAL